MPNLSEPMSLGVSSATVRPVRGTVFAVGCCRPKTRSRRAARSSRRAKATREQSERRWALLPGERQRKIANKAARGKSPNILVEMLRRSAMPDYDYIIVGGGSAGCVMANQLSEDPHAQVL
jgi:hypothetical protein